MKRLLGSLGSLFLLACGGATPPPAEPEAPASEESTKSSEAAPAPVAAAAPEPSGPATIPSSCHSDGKVCTADPKWVKKLCSDIYPDVALVLFGPSSPFTRGYLTRKTKAVNASGGVTSGDEYLVFDEEVVLLYSRGGPAGGIQVSGAEGGYDAIRWDGSCVTLDSSEVTLNKAPSPKRGRIDWRFLGEDVQEALKAVPGVRDAYAARKKECKGAYSGDVSKACVKADEGLMKAIAEAVQSGQAKLPEPAKRP
ncbi:MAG TPA: hypothetical protein VLC09_03830 [Polyangiaceae bacterium]|nr:hypothetical protein [Polyangiaceae bacterium]